MSQGAVEPPPVAVVRADFDRIAEVQPEGDVDPVVRRMLRSLPPPRRALDVGCGSGALTRWLARDALEVVGIDLSPRMIARARAATEASPNLRYEVADVMRWEPGAPFDLITAVASLHHVPLAPALARLAAWVRPGGSLVVHDLVRSASPWELVVDAAALCVGVGERLARGRADPEVTAAWREHGAHDVYPTLCQVRAACRAHLPGARVRRRLRWRYTILWTRRCDA